MSLVLVAVGVFVSLIFVTQHFLDYSLRFFDRELVGRLLGHWLARTRNVGKGPRLAVRLNRTDSENRGPVGTLVNFMHEFFIQAQPFGAGRRDLLVVGELLVKAFANSLAKRISPNLASDDAVTLSAEAVVFGQGLVTDFLKVLVGEVRAHARVCGLGSILVCLLEVRAVARAT